MSFQIVVGIDGGGTRTRFMAVDLHGRVRSYVEAGSCRRMTNPDVESMMHQSIKRVVSDAGCELSDVVGIVAGLADVDHQSDEEWAEKFTALPELTCSRLHVNDSVVAYAAALQNRAGIMVSGGTNWTSLAVTDTGHRIDPYSFHYYGVGAGQLASSILIRILSGNYSPQDRDLVAQILDHFQVDNTKALAELLVDSNLYPNMGVGKRSREIAPLTTQAATMGVPLARTVCDQAIERVSTAILLQGGCFTSEPVPVGLMGSVVRCDYIRLGVEQVLAENAYRAYEVIQSPLTAAAGAAWMALDRYGIKDIEGIVRTLKGCAKAVL